MACTHDCNQGRACSCRAKPARPPLFFEVWFAHARQAWQDLRAEFHVRRCRGIGRICSAWLAIVGLFR